MKRKISGIVSTLVFAVIALLICFPIILLVSGMLKSSDELQQTLAPVLSEGTGTTYFSLLPMYPSLENLLSALFDKPEFYMVFGNSLLIVLATLAGQLLIGAPSAWAFARFRFTGKKILFTAYIVLMMMPFSVTMLSNYLVLNKLSLINNLWGIILPGIFSTFPIFIMYRSFTGIPESLLEAARVDGAGEWKMFFDIGLPLGSAGIGSSMVLGFLEYFSLIEQPLAFLEDKNLWPLALYLPQIEIKDAGYAFAASVLVLIPAVLVFVIGRDYLEKGIIASALKE